MPDNREYPDISFVDADTERLKNNLIAAYQVFTGRTLYPADPVRLFILWIADIIIQERVIINESAKQNVPRYAEGEYLDSLAELFKDTWRLPATAAVTTIRCHISAAQATAIIVPRGTRVSVDGEITFETAENLTIAPGALFGDVGAVCLKAGEAGNGFIPGQISQIVDLYPFYTAAENITTSDGGADVESDAAFYGRLRESMETFSAAGPSGAYIYWAKTASQNIVDVSATSPTPGIVDIRILLHGGELPDEETIQLVQETLSAETVRPLTDVVQVAAPETAPFDIAVSYWIASKDAASATVIQAAANAAVNEYIAWQTSKMGRDIIPSRLISALMTAGVKRVEVASPAYTVIPNDTVARLNTQSVTYGGIEDE
jgi:phage-related baseplate assembly protein